MQKAFHPFVNMSNKMQLNEFYYLQAVKAKKGSLLSYQIRSLLFIPFLLLLLFASRSVIAQNAIVTENQNAGNPASEWDISGAGDLNIQGFATDISINKGETVRFKIKAAASYTI